MKLENQVCSLKLAQKLKKLGMKQKSLFYWIKFLGNDECVWYYSPAYLDHQNDKETISAFTVAELGEMLPVKAQDVYHEILTTKEGSEYGWTCAIHNVVSGKYYKKFVANTEADARAKMLIYLLENGLVTL